MIPSALQSQHQQRLKPRQGKTSLKGSMSTDFRKMNLSPRMRTDSDTLDNSKKMYSGAAKTFKEFPPPQEICMFMDEDSENSEELENNFYQQYSHKSNYIFLVIFIFLSKIVYFFNLKSSIK
jgi:hypothetical protein